MRRKLSTPINAVFRFADKQSGFIAYLKEKYSDYSVYRTIGYIQSHLVCDAVKLHTGSELIYEVTDKKRVNQIHRTVHNSEQDLRLHNVYSSAVHRYLQYISSV